MNIQWFHAIALLTPATFLGLAVYLRRQPYGWPTAAAFAPAGIAVLAALVAALTGAGDSPLLGKAGLGLAARLDALSVTLLLLVSTIGGTVLHYSRQYLQGDARHPQFMSQLSLTLAAVTTLVIADNLYLMMLAWVAMSLCLHQLLLFRPERPGARVAAGKKYMLARVGDLSLIIAFGILIDTLGTANLSELLAALKAFDATTGDTTGLAVAASLIALTAMLKSAQFPSHGWLVEVMETPTPVSALLHAGVVNAGGFLILRFADLMTLTPTVSLVVAGVGITTAILGAAMMMTQPTVKGSLAYSTVAQMGFMMAQCGLGAYSAAVVHLVGHSLYKAYAFLGSGGAVASVREGHWTSARQASSWYAGLPLLALMLGAYVTVGATLGMSWQEAPVVVSLGAIFVMGAWLYADAGRQTLKVYSLLLASVAGASALYFGIQLVAHWLLATTLPATPELGLAAKILLGSLLTACLLMTVAQGRWLHGRDGTMAALRHHLSQGLYINLIVNRWLGAFSSRRSDAV